MNDTQEDRAQAQLRAGVYGRLSETYDAAESVPTQLDRGTGHAEPCRTSVTACAGDTGGGLRPGRPTAGPGRRTRH
jgi:hypothetical protein